MIPVTIYTDGSCLGNPGPGGYAAILLQGTHKKEICGSAENTTNNRMELSAVICGLSAITKPCEITVYSDSKYVVDAINQNWIDNWVKNGWHTSSGKPVANADLWQKLIPLVKHMSVKLVWVKGHADNEWNQRCDEIARSAAMAAVSTR